MTDPVSLFHLSVSFTTTPGTGLLPSETQPDMVWTDGPLQPPDLTLGLAEILAAAGPWGQGFPEPLFDNPFVMLEQRVIGERHLKLRVRHPDGGGTLDAVAFGQPPLAQAAGSLTRFIYRLDVNTYRDSRTAQLVVEHVDCD